MGLLNVFIGISLSSWIKLSFTEVGVFRGRQGRLTVVSVVYNLKQDCESTAAQVIVKMKRIGSIQLIPNLP